MAKKEQQNKTDLDERSIIERIAFRQNRRDAILLPVLSVLTALIIGMFIIALSDPKTLGAAKDFFSAPGEVFYYAGQAIYDAYSAMLEGAFGNPVRVITAFFDWQSTGDAKTLLNELRPISESLVIATPYILAGLGVAMSFQGGMVNIGAEGQLFVAGLASVFIGYTFKNLPWFIHLPFAMLAGLAAGALWGFIPGFLKAKTGAHEVINTIMMNYIAFRLTDYLLSGPMAKTSNLPITPDVLPTAYLPRFLPSPVRLHWGFLFALGMAWLIHFLLYKTTFGMEIRMIGKNPKAARYAGISVTLLTTMIMTMSGGIAGLAGVNQALGVDHRMVRAFSSGYGFDAIALALLGNNNPFGIVLASLLFGFLRGGAARMQSTAGTPVELIRIIQGVVVIFVAAPEIIRALYRMKGKGDKALSVKEPSKE